jgi:hypothetical protein
MKAMSSVVIGLVRDIDPGSVASKSFSRGSAPKKTATGRRLRRCSPASSAARVSCRRSMTKCWLRSSMAVFDHPYVIGFLWNGADPAPDNSQTNRIIVTPGGHELRFEDKEGDKRVVLKTKDGHVLALDDKDQSITLESKAHHKLEIKDQSGKVTLTTQSGGKVTLDNAPGKATIEVAPNRIVISPTGISIEAVSGSLGHHLIYGNDGHEFRSDDD